MLFTKTREKTGGFKIMKVMVQKKKMLYAQGRILLSKSKRDPKIFEEYSNEDKENTCKKLHF